MQSKTQCCGNCRFRLLAPNSLDYLCRRYPPLFNYNERGGKFPIVTLTIWCGDWMPDNDTTAHLPAPYA